MTSWTWLPYLPPLKKVPTVSESVLEDTIGLDCGSHGCRFNMVNGFLIPGGYARLRPGHTFFDTAAEVVRLANEANDKGDYFPIFAICLGFGTLAVIASGNTSILGR